MAAKTFLILYGNPSDTIAQKNIMEMKEMIIGILLTVLLGGGLSAVGTFLIGYLGFWASFIVLFTIGVLTMFLYQSHVPPRRNKQRRAEDKA